MNPGYREALTTLVVSEQMQLLYGFLLEIPISMVVFSRILRDTTNKWTNVLTGTLMLLGSLASLYSADTDDAFFAVVNTMALLVIIRTAWKWPPLESKTAQVKSP